MQQIKSFLNFLDVIVGTFWGFTLVDIIPILGSGPIVLSSIDNVIKILFSLVGLVYAVIRMLHFIQMSKLNREFRRQEIFEKRLMNFKQRENDTR